MADTALTPAGRRVLEAASDLFYRVGIHAVGVDMIAAAAGVTKKTLYDRFGAKDQLVAAYLRARDVRWRAWLADEVARAEPGGGAGAEAGGAGAGGAEAARARLLRTFDALDGWLRQTSPRGCAFVNALAELSDPNHPGRAVISEQKRWLRDYLTALAAETGAGDPRALAEQLFLLHEGAAVAHATGTVDDAAARARQAAGHLLRAR